MKISLTSISVLFLLIVTSCGQSKEVKQKKELEKLAKEVMAAHDRTMDADHYGQLRPLKKQLLEIETAQTDSLVKNELINTSIDLDKADTDMMDWMHHYKAPDDFLPFEEQKSYYQDEKKKIEEIEKRTNEAIDHAKELINKYGK
jgi:hypothetical protein